MEKTGRNQNALSPEARFTLLAIENLRSGKSKGIHTVFSGYNDAFRKHFGKDAIKTVTELVTQGVIESRPTKKGFMLYKKGEMPDTHEQKVDRALAAITAKM